MNDLAGITSGAVTNLSRAQILRLQDEVMRLSQIEPPTRHFFAPGLYGREMFAPAGSIVVGKIHRLDHMCVVLGDISVFSVDAGLRRITGCETFISRAGTKRALLAHADTWWTTFHPNPDDERDLERLEQRLIAPDFEALDADLAQRAKDLQEAIAP
jgi:hypothetical protein